MLWPQQMFVRLEDLFVSLLEPPFGLAKNSPFRISQSWTFQSHKRCKNVLLPLRLWHTDSHFVHFQPQFTRFSISFAHSFFNRQLWNRSWWEQTVFYHFSFESFSGTFDTSLRNFWNGTWLVTRFGWQKWRNWCTEPLGFHLRSTILPLHNRFALSLEQLWRPEASVSLHPPETYLSWQIP